MLRLAITLMATLAFATGCQRYDVVSAPSMPSPPIYAPLLVLLLPVGFALLRAIVSGPFSIGDGRGQGARREENPPMTGKATR
jgi:hypothetical protein